MSGSMTREEALNVCRLVAGLVVTDDDLDPREDAFIDRMLKVFSIAPDERDFIFPIVDATEAEAALRAIAPEVQARALTLLVQAAAADGRIAPEERVYLETVGDALGVARDELEVRIAAALQG